ncbi:hypothetical protein BKK56_02235 [Rodentibacter genomosp. 2]|uniref:hypothetical protein n=1 Tax=Rodentibacter genomosp. 2 TaxID=1908266 RepID=UPI0009848F0E|nr:hypothetical protein BKK56_02235 [Rodentibacter genomosp. 2]
MQNVTLTKGSIFDAGGNRLTNIGNATAETDATTLVQVKDLISHATTNARNLNTTNLTVGNATVTNGTITNLNSTNGTITNLDSDNITANNGMFNTTLVSKGETTLSGNTIIGGGAGTSFTVAKDTKVDMDGNVVGNIGDGNISQGSKEGVTGGQLYTAIQNFSNVTDKGMNFTGNDGVIVNRKLGETLTVKGSLGDSVDADILIFARFLMQQPALLKS